jgi:23S rRNA (pseudouridine1915-N3)-methyltransferase
MRIHVLAVGTRMPAWVEEGYREYVKRLPPHCRLELKEIPLPRRGKGADIARMKEAEEKRLLAAVPAGSRVVALDAGGTEFDTAQLARRLGDWLAGGTDIALLIGGPDGLSAKCLAAAQERWSLSRLTLAHPLVRVVLAEQIYRAWSLLNNMPYHRD